MSIASMSSYVCGLFSSILKIRDADKVVQHDNCQDGT